MARGNRHYLPGGYVWHLTHRCHKREFLLKFGRDRRTWIRWLFEAKKRYGLCVLNYMVTCNHVHLLVEDTGGEAMARSIQLVAGRTAWEYNRRKGRKGAFWEDRYHATAVEADTHLSRCLVYIDTNMVRGGVVRDPGDWAWCGYHEIQNPPQRYTIIDRKRLMDLLGMNAVDELPGAHRGWIDDALGAGEVERDRTWTESIAAGGRSFVEEVGEKLGQRGFGRGVMETETGHELRERQASYKTNLAAQNGLPSPGNTYAWEVY
jgi:REP element-mobilizing transposase RayT